MEGDPVVHTLLAFGLGTHVGSAGEVAILGMVTKGHSMGCF